VYFVRFNTRDICCAFMAMYYFSTITDYPNLLFPPSLIFTINSSLLLHTYIYNRMGTANGGTVVKVLCYKLEGRWFDSRWFHWNFPLT
jgi:hypothetical protein